VKRSVLVRIDADYARGFLLRAADFSRRGDLETAEKVLRAGLAISLTNELLIVGVARILSDRALRLREASPV